MGFDIEEKKKTFLYADLLKPEENRDKNNSVIMSQWRSPSWNSWSACEWSSSGSELDSSESEDGDFTAELSRQMVECMLHEEDEEERRNSSLTHSAQLHHQTLKYGSNSNRPVMDHANRTPCIKVKSESPVGVWRARRVTNFMQTRKREQKYGEWRSGSEMRAIFLGGSGSTYGSSGTGVFLPPVTNYDPVHQKNKSGLSTVLIPTRVLEALEHHFTRLSPSATATSSHYVSPRPREEWVRSKGQGNKQTKLEMEVAKAKAKANKVDEIQILPQEWTY